MNRDTVKFDTEPMGTQPARLGDLIAPSRLLGASDGLERLDSLRCLNWSSALRLISRIHSVNS